jgi:hypothetical protein
MKRNIFNLLIILSVIAGSVFVTSCDEGYRINTKKMIQDEQDLMQDYLLTVEDTLAANGDSINRMESEGYLFFELQEGTGDPVEVGKKVAFRFVYYEIVRDSTGVSFIYPYSSNYHSEYPRSYTVGDVNPSNGLYSGIDLAISHMTYGSKARVFVSSSLWTQDYTPRVIDLEVTYVEK